MLGSLHSINHLAGDGSSAARFAKRSEVMLGCVAAACSAATRRRFSWRSTLRFAKRSEVLLGRVAAACSAATRRELG